MKLPLFFEFSLVLCVISGDLLLYVSLKLIAIYVVLTAFRCLNKQVEEDALDVVIDDKEGNLGLKAFAVGTVGNGALYRIVCTRYSSFFSCIHVSFRLLR